jgi:hypothetical protein
VLVEELAGQPARSGTWGRNDHRPPVDRLGAKGRLAIVSNFLCHAIGEPAAGTRELPLSAVAPAVFQPTPGKDMPYTLLVSLVLASALMLNPAAQAQGGPARASMERCVERVLSRLARAKAPEGEVRNAVLSGCDGPLRATLAEAIKSGEARMCASFDACIDLARKQTADEAKEAYRARLGR